MKHRSYQEFEIKGQISLENFIKVLRGLDSLEDIENVLNVKDKELFEKKHLQKTFNTLPPKNPTVNNKKNSNSSDIEIPDVFGR
jgi:hypothetical protein